MEANSNPLKEHANDGYSNRYVLGMHLENSGLKPFRDILDQLNLTDLARPIEQLRNGSGRQDWPVEGMLRSTYAMSILQHRGTESFRRELQRNPHLMLALGFKLKPSEGSDEEGPHRPCRVPSAAAFSRIRQQLCQLEFQTGVVKADLFRQREKLSEHLPAYGKEIGYDGKAIDRIPAGRNCRTSALRKVASS